MTRLGAKLSSHPHADKDAYRKMKKHLKPHEASSTSIDVKNYMRSLVAAVSIFDIEI